MDKVNESIGDKKAKLKQIKETTGNDKLKQSIEMKLNHLDKPISK